MTAPKALPNTLALIGNTPLVLLKGPSEAAGCEIWGKCEFMNPGARSRTARRCGSSATPRRGAS